MDRSDVIYLVSTSYAENQYGVLIGTDQERKVYCNVASVSQREWFEGGRNGLNPEYKFTMFEFDYNGEKVVKYRDEYYTIYRTYMTGNDEIELYAERKQGNVKRDDSGGQSGGNSQPDS